MEPVLNPLYCHGDGASSLKSPQRAVPRASNQNHQQHSSRTATGGRCVPAVRTCFSRTPWFVVLGVSILIAALITWVVFTDKFLGSTRALLGKVQVAPPEGIAYALYIIKVVLIVVTSFLGALMLLLGVVVRRQGLIKKSASTRADWPHGCSSHSTLTLALFTAALLWLLAAFYVVLLCCTFTATGVALTGHLAAQHALSLQPNKNPLAQLQQLRVSLGNTRSAFVAASNKAPPVIKRTPWFKALEESVLPHLQPKPEGSAAEGDSSCPETCLNLRLVSTILKRNATTTDSCLCLRAALEEAGRHLDSMWRDGMVVMLCLAVLAIIATWLMVYCNVACVSIRRDHNEATYHKKHLPLDGQRDGGISKWMWTAGIGSPHSPSDTMSSFPAIENPTDAKRPQHGMGADFASNARSPSPRKQAKWGTAAAAAGQDDQMERGGAGHQLSDVERPAQQIQPDQSPLHSPERHSRRPDQLQLPAATPVSTGLLAGSAVGSTVAVNRADAPSSTTSSSYRRRWQDSVGQRK